MPDAVIVSTARTPIGRAYRGAFNNTHGATLGGHVISHAVKRAGLEPGEVEDVILGCALPEGATGQNIARQAALRGGLPVTTSGATVNRFCSSGMQAIAIAAQRILVDRVPIMVAGGLESVSMVQNGCPASTPVSNRIVVPELPQKRSAPLSGMCPLHPVTSTAQSPSSAVTAIPRARRASIISNVSSANRTFLRTLVPSASEAATSARLVRLFDPGSTTVASSGPEAGVQ